ncbi:Hypothetical protein ZAZAV_597 [Cedratvirus Zaza IHUMI]|uniref:Uncharacterized protein n=1 Tax=Cedratvirus Zaza IHUMI TaxID=2126979 RepID=A0A2R8FG57_9VIRU|nr:Hypothetical protein ZAZAV_597 [Cedratvirus Zaza IHUMI]
MEDTCCLCLDKIVLPKIGEKKKVIWARCLSSSCFFTDDWKSCKFRKDLPLKEDGIICSACLDKYAYDEVLVTCDLCSSKYESVYGEYQGWHCSSTVRSSQRFLPNGKIVREDCIMGEYGSTKYDLYRVWFVNGRPKHIKPGFTICDNCISLLIYKDVCKQPTDHDRL